ncbi:hypothetical protein [Lysobacter sp. Root494]|uniref:hypothetical protein n=1 Tax=Lysobacter sp. Root494 TaxID=1736549 RepID=UPI0006F82F96|nr:hypothetical protein [Lysobacter sp. Root494]KQY55139.1 hypothetical protein ASD14_03010 [Lysobacter sp. Root494]
MHSRPAAFYVVAGGFTLATLDLIYACSFWAWLRHVSPMRLLQYIASGALGEAAFDGGIGTALLGAGFHYFIATIMVLAYYLASRRYRALVQYPVRYGLPYGLLLWGVMTYVVVPLSQAQTSAKPVMLAFVTNFLMHLLFGVICAGFSRRAHGLRR